MTSEMEPMEQAPLPEPTYSDSGFMPVLSIQEAQRRFNALRQFVRDNMRKDVDYGVIPGTGDKPTLLKPGAEKLCTFFGLRSSFEVIDRTLDWERGFFNFWYKCRLWRGELCIAEGEGSANSYERKYRWRTVPLFKATEDEKGRAVREETRTSRNGTAYKMLILENDDPYTLVNTLQKMAQKRALIAATLIAVNASEFFTQDIEDMVVDSDLDASRGETGRGDLGGEERQGGGDGGGGRRGGETSAEPSEAPAEEIEEITLKFRERPSQDTLQTIKSAGFRWNPKKVVWHAPASAERQALAEELSRKGELQQSEIRHAA